MIDSDTTPRNAAPNLVVVSYFDQRPILRVLSVGLFDRARPAHYLGFVAVVVDARGWANTKHGAMIFIRKRAQTPWQIWACRCCRSPSAVRERTFGDAIR